MATTSSLMVRDGMGRQGTILPETRRREQGTDVVTVRLEDGRELAVPVRSLLPQADGTYQMLSALDGGSSGPQRTEPPAPLPVAVRPEPVTDTVRTSRTDITPHPLAQAVAPPPMPQDAFQPASLARSEHREPVLEPLPPAAPVRGIDYRDPVPAPAAVTMQSAGYREPVAAPAVPARGNEYREQVSVPVYQEEIEVQKRLVDTGAVRIHKSVQTREELVDVALQGEEIEVTRHEVNRVVDGPVPVRYEGDTLVVSLLEEEIVVQKRLVVREELHIRRKAVERRSPVRVPIRTEQVQVERTGPLTGSAPQDPPQNDGLRQP